MIGDNPKKQALDKAKKALDEAAGVYDGSDLDYIANKVSQDFAETVEPMLIDMRNQIALSGKEIIDSMSKLKIEVPKIDTPTLPAYPAFPNFPEIKLPTINVPKPEVTVNIPKAETPIVHVAAPVVNFPDTMKLGGITNKSPLPVILTDPLGKPYVAGMFGGNESRGPVVIRDILTQQGRSVMDEANNAIRVNLAVGSVSLTSADGALLDGTSSARATVMQLAGLNPQAVAIVDASGTQITSFGGNTNVQDGQGSTITSHVFGDFRGLDVNLASALDQSIDSVAVRQVSGFTDSVNVVGFSSSVSVVGPVVAGATDDGSAPFKQGGIARTTNPTPMSDGQIVSKSMDKMGRTLTRPMQVRDLISTAYVTLSTGTEATLLSGVTGTFLDLIYIMAANTSTAAVQIDIRAVTAGNIMLSLEIPANGTAGISLPIPLPQDATGNNWTVDMPDITNSNVLVSALFSKES